MFKKVALLVIAALTFSLSAFAVQTQSYTVTAIIPQYLSSDDASMMITGAMNTITAR
jgi:hypothetical protein